MNYKFPIIKRIEDVLPAIEGRDEFIVAERDDYDVINYMVGMPDTFSINENDVMDNYGEMIPKGVMRRECRGIIFDKAGNIMSRPFHKFFNVGERDETQLNVLDLSAEHVIMEKMDGSMLRPLLIGGKIRMGTKMGLTDIGADVDAHLKLYGESAIEWLADIMAAGKTPLFEYVSPDNRIVLKYNETELVLLAIRDNETGAYLSMRSNVFAVVPTYGSVKGNFGDYIERQRELEGREGDIIRFADGHMLKIKNEWYVKIHKVKDMIRTDRHILALVLDSNIDDVLPHLDAEDINYIHSYEDAFWKAYKAKVEALEAVAISAVNAAGSDRKKLATDILPASTLKKHEYRFVFSYADGKPINDTVMAHVRVGLGNGNKYDAIIEWLGLGADKEA